MGDTSKYRLSNNPQWQHLLATNSQVYWETRAFISSSITCFQAGTDIAFLYDLSRHRRQGQGKLAKGGIKMIIENKMGNMMISTRPFIFAEGKMNIKIGGRCWCLMVEDVDLPLERRNQPELVQRQDFFVDERRRIWNPLEAVVHVALQCSLVTLGRCMRQDRWWKRDILRCSDWTLGEQYGTDPRNVTSVDTKYFLLEEL